MNIKTANTILYCKKWAETVAFYAEVLHLKAHFSNEWFVEFWLNADARLSIANEERASIKSGDGQGITIGFQVEELQTVHHQLIEAGYYPTPIKARWGSQVFYVSDPEGNRLEFWS
ncbi:MAG: hypothetical protein U0175_03675 [Caldilineaceae bacterium]